MKSKRDGFFWVSYTDVMITLFFVMLAIAAISVYQLDEARRVSEEKLKRIEEIQKAVTDLKNIKTKEATPTTDGLPIEKEVPMFQVSNNRFETKPIKFERGQFAISEIDKPYLQEVGRELKKLVSSAKDGAGYLIVIEGGADPTGDCWNDVFALSYQRAYALWELWISQGIDLKRPGVSDLQISGSGDQVPIPCNNINKRKEFSFSGRATRTDDDLRRFSIHVLPLIPNVDEIK
jgi:outer membrane protein OmpA-like peptidoglycan-associated protein